MAESGFVVVVPEAEALVGALRWEHDQSARLGVPAHVTVLFPFMDPANIDEEVFRACARVLAAQPSFSFTLGSVGRFAETAYLEPRPAKPFIALTQALAAAFPAYPPYRGEFPSVIPHLTVAHGSAAAAALVEAALVAGLATRGAVSSRCTSIVLLDNSSSVWRPMHVFPLASATGT
jgi:2'-5' RNA ligase